ncbi:MAG: hypothetical protein K2R98_12900 [Gemmataceae bacterium]|nr:hypothetical protein [Gemmataceae bacterium]
MSNAADNDKKYRSPSSSPNCVDVVIDGPGDTTVRPIRPSMLKRAMEERDKIRKWEEELRQEQAGDPSGTVGRSKLVIPQCVDVVIDGPGDTTVRPIRPSMLKQAIAEREKIRKWEEEQKQQQADEHPSSDGDPTNGA